MVANLNHSERYYSEKLALIISVFKMSSVCENFMREG